LKVILIDKLIAVVLRCYGLLFSVRFIDCVVYSFVICCVYRSHSPKRKRASSSRSGSRGRRRSRSRSKGSYSSFSSRWVLLIQFILWFLSGLCLELVKLELVVAHILYKSHIGMSLNLALVNMLLNHW